MTAAPKHDHSTPEFEPRRIKTGSIGGYCFVKPRRTRDTIPSPPPAPMRMPVASHETVDPEPNHDFEEMTVTIEMPRPAPLAAFIAYHDPKLCSCVRMLKALSDKIVDVIFDGPVTLPPAVMTEDAMMSGRWDAIGVERAYDGKPWAFRFCPFEDQPIVLLDDQVELPEMLHDGHHCCATMRQADMHGRVELPSPEKTGQLPLFVRAGQSGTSFLTCPWCATSTIDLGVERLKRHFATRKP